MESRQNYNKALPIRRQLTPPSEGGKGEIHIPGQYNNLIWQSRYREPEEWELTLIANLETLFDNGADTLELLVDGLNELKFYDRQDKVWDETSFSEFMRSNGY